MSECILCGKPADYFPVSGAYDHINCSKCGEYKITYPCKHRLTLENRYLVCGYIFQKYHYDNQVITITSDILEKCCKLEGELIIEDKIYFLAKYIYFYTRQNGIGSIIANTPNGCCYEKNNDELLEYLQYLKNYSIINFFLRENGNSRIFGDIKMTIKGYSIFENGVNDSSQFMEKIMDKSQSIRIDHNNGNIAIGANNIQSNINNQTINESELIKSLINNGISIDVIDNLREEFRQFIIENSKDVIDTKNTETLLMKIKRIGGNIVLNGLAILAKPEIVQVIENVKKMLVE